MSYRVFARKYRPQTFAEVVGQDHITRTLQNAVTTKRLAQAYLFVGPRGIGKTSTARILAKALNCKQGISAEPCGQCDSCLEIAEGRSLDVIEIDGASNNGVENIRDLRESAAYAPASGEFKIYLIDEVHMLSTGAFNALLKTLEEPPPHVKFIFATTEAQKVPATITSRCQRFDLRRIPSALIQKHLLHIAKCEEIQLGDSAAETLARGADGGLRDAESMLDQMVSFCGTHITQKDVMDVFGFTPLEVVKNLADALFAGDVRVALEIIAEQSDAGKDLMRLTAELVAHLRDLLVAQATGAVGRISQAKLLDLIEHFSAAEGSMKWVADKKLQLDVAIIKALHLLDETSLTDVIQTLTGLCHGEVPAPRPAPRAPAPSPQPSPKAAPVPPPPAASPVPEPVAKIAPAEPPAPVPSSGSDQAVDNAVIWEKIAADFSKNSFIRFGWLRDGVFDRMDAGKIFIRFPESAREAATSYFMEEGLKEIERRLKKEFDRPMKLEMEFDESLQAESPVEEKPEPREEPVAAKEIAPPPPEEPPADPMADFMNDPLIEKALEIFKSTLQTRQA
ncbi:MAG: polymerase subunit tau [Verrucomicrobiota bacterium]